MLTIITPFYARQRDDYLYERMRRFVAQEPLVEGIHRLIVDFGSPQHVVDDLAAYCQAADIRLLSLGRRGEPFSAGACRNHGAQVASTEFIAFQDVDLTAPPSVYQRLARSLRLASPNFNHLECLPCLYLTPAGTLEYESMEPEAAKARFQEYFAEGDVERIQMYAPATSAIVLRRSFYLSMGGMRQEFFGHGYEDFELMNRLAWKARRFIRSHDYYSHDYKYGALEYRGYRSFFSLFGRQNMASGMFFCHLYHPTPALPGYAKRNAANRMLFERFVKALDTDLELPPALCDGASTQRTLALSGRNTIPMKSIRMAIAHLGNVVYMEPGDFADAQTFVSYVRENRFNRVLFLTPYGNEQRLALYHACKADGIPFLVFDRGALPGSWFFDPCGFNADSASYAPPKWNFPLSAEAKEAAERYIDALVSSEETLEENGDRIGAENLRAKYNLHGKKVLFVPMQRPGDSVIRHFAGHAESVENFCFVLSQLSLRLPPDWRVVVKRHPLETTMPPVPGAIELAPATHVYDALSACDAVLTVNSGVGLLSLLFGKPTYNFGSAFYCHAGLSTQVCGLEDIVNRVVELRAPSQEHVLRFVHYLTDVFYSFADTQCRKVNEGGATRNVAVNLDFTELRLPGQTPRTFLWRTEPARKNSPVYDFYREYIARMGKPVATPTKVAASKSATTRAPIKAAVPDVQKAGPASNVPAARRMPGTTARKLSKLIRDPRRFFVDAVRNRVG
ncbi:capsular polysaccharide export protein, LipB/KpsS family [Cupriavidus oxalaticus]|uniref:Glycosyltransferase n=1 Tax=Cupriavidus oxalaticus TaxID=96344 RepID=A0A375GNX4_9BURK|nr:glycosyltransferase [Cupriavidus oxalaticus]QRQ83608.1 glycosyltransferase [Cupriavidus oxalaticus]QRQ92303.1 glycosyltransferase [Cupriavidus oxalaticus]WQD86916.1 glycosyltransferase [Cupriavidus oxalaticus]SPC24969.1 conserved hypothetical protein [Cupriavidus oxalaticus]